MSVMLELLDDTDEQGRPLFQLLREYEYEVGPEMTVTVPRGYTTNFGTIPRFFYRLISPAELREAAIVHDYMCDESLLVDVEVDSGYSRWLADAVLYQAMEEIGIGPIRRTLVYAAVRAWAIFKGLK